MTFDCCDKEDDCENKDIKCDTCRRYLDLDYGEYQDEFMKKVAEK